MRFRNTAHALVRKVFLLSLLGDSEVWRVFDFVAE